MNLISRFVGLVCAFGVLTAAVAAETTEMSADTGAYDSPLNAALDIQFTPIRFPSYRWPEGMSDPKSGQGLHLGFEWMPFHRIYGKLGLGVGTGFYQIKSVVVNEDLSTALYAIPAEAYLTYRFDYVRNQILVPFIKGGTSAVFAQQTYRTGAQTPTYAYHGLDYGGGLELCLNAIDYTSSRALDASTGINATYLVFEYFRSQQLNTASLTAPNLAREELRFGIRFEM